MADPWDDWEQANETEIQAPVVTPKRTPMILQRKKTPDPKPALDNVSLHEQNRAIWDKANAYEQPVIARTDNSMRTEYVPEIRILRRPKSPVTAVRVAATPSKPLEQRQADYNAAREKIFGPQDPSNSSSSSSTSPSPSSSRPGSRRGSPTPRSSATQVIQGQGQGPAPVKPIEFRGAPPPKIRPAQRSVSGGGNAQDHVVRQPRGPTMAAPASHNNNNSPRSLMARPPQESRNDVRGGQGGTKTRGDALGPSSSSSSSSSSGGSIGFRKPFKGGPPSSCQSSSPLP